MSRRTSAAFSGEDFNPGAALQISEPVDQKMSQVVLTQCYHRVKKSASIAQEGAAPIQAFLQDFYQGRKASSLRCLLLRGFSYTIS